jgi:hypothetical protein
MRVAANECRFCHREWTPKPGVNANESYCNACSDERQRRAKEVFGDDGKVERLVGKYLIRVPKESA